MTTTITPGIGQAPLFTQGGAGSSPGYSAIDLRRSDSLGLQEGVYGTSDFMVVQRGAGANMSVDIGMPAGGFACVQGDAVSGQGLYTVPVHSATINETITAANPSIPRIDQVVLEVLDNVHDGSGGNRAQIRVVPGSATAGATLDNRTGASALPSSALLLADVLVGAAVSSVDNTKIRDRRKWARGAYMALTRTTNASAGADYGRGTATFADVDATNITRRIECSGAPLSIRFLGQFVLPTAAKVGQTQMRLDGTALDGTRDWYGAVANQAYAMDWKIEVTPAAGSHVIGPAYQSTDGVTVFLLLARSTLPLTFAIEEIVRPNTPNNSTTSG